MTQNKAGYMCYCGSPIIAMLGTCVIVVALLNDEQEKIPLFVLGADRKISSMNHQLALYLLNLISPYKKTVKF